MAHDAPNLPALSLTENETAVYDLIDRDSTPIDDIIRRGGLPASAVAVALLGLEMKRLIKQLPGKVFVRNG
jgi:DNA processing protein